MANSVKIQKVSPEDLHTVLPVTTLGMIRFKDDKQMDRYRRRLYAINKENAAGLRYRSEKEYRGSLTLYVWRMK